MLASFFLVVTLSSIGLPGMNGFVGEVLVLLGTFLHNRTYAAVAALGMILGAVYMLRMYQRVFLGTITVPENERMGDINMREVLVLVPIVALMFWMGVYSSPFLSRMDASLRQVQDRIQHARAPEGGYRVEQPRLQAPMEAKR